MIQEERLGVVLYVVVIVMVSDYNGADFSVISQSLEYMKNIIRLDSLLLCSCFFYLEYPYLITYQFLPEHGSLLDVILMIAMLCSGNILICGYG